MIPITINGKPRELEGDTPLPQLLKALKVNPRLVAVAINGEVVPKNQYKRTVVREGDEVEIVRMVGGGSSDTIQQAQAAVCKVVCPDLHSMGTGFFVTTDTVVTCDHVVAHEVLTPQGLIRWEPSRQIEVHTERGATTATIISSTNSTDPYFYDYAVLKVASPNASTLNLADFASIDVGADAILLGFPLGSAHLVATRAMVAAKPRIPSHRNRIVSLDVVQLDGSVNVGNSGGPAIATDSKEVVGIVSVRYGSIAPQLEAYRKGLGTNPPRWLAELLDILERSNEFMNPGLGYAVSTQYVRAELQRLRVL